jgi:hypothetical protein
VGDHRDRRTPHRRDATQKAVQMLPALEQFYSSLSNEQKARFNTLNAQASRAN